MPEFHTKVALFGGDIVHRSVGGCHRSYICSSKTLVWNIAILDRLCEGIISACLQSEGVRGDKVKRRNLSESRDRLRDVDLNRVCVSTRYVGDIIQRRLTIRIGR